MAGYDVVVLAGKSSYVRGGEVVLSKFDWFFGGCSLLIALVSTLCIAAASLGPSSARVDEVVRHELPIVTHWSNKAKAFEYMASDQPVYRAPGAQTEYQPGNSYYYYREGDHNFLPDYDNYVGMNYSLKAITDKQVIALAARVHKASGVHLKFYRPDAFTSRNDAFRLEEAPGYVQVLHAKIIRTDEDDPGCLATFFLPPNWRSDAPVGTYPIVTVGHYDLNEHVFLPTPNGRGDTFGSIVARSGVDGRTGAIGVIWNGGGALATYTLNARAFKQFGKIVDYAAEELGGDRHCVMATGNSRSGITAINVASNPLRLNYTMKFVSAGSFAGAGNPEARDLAFTTTYPKQLRNLCGITGFQDSWKPGWTYPSTDGVHVRVEDVNQETLVNTHLAGKDVYQVAGHILSGSKLINVDLNQFSDNMINGILEAGTYVFLEVRTNDILPHFNMLEYANKLEEKMKARGEVRLHVDFIARAGHAWRRILQRDFALNEQLWKALLQFVDPNAPKSPLVKPGKGYYQIDRNTRRFKKVELKDGMHPFAMDMPIGVVRGDKITLVCTGHPGTTYRVELNPTEGLDATGFKASGVIASDTTMRGVSFIDVPLDQPIGKYRYRLWIQKPGQAEKELNHRHTVSGGDALMEIWDEKSTDNIVSGEFVWRKLYMPLMPKSLGPVIWGFSEY